MKFLLDIRKCAKPSDSIIRGGLATLATTTRHLLGLLLLLVLFLPSADAQNRKELETRRKKLIEDIKVTSSLLNKKAKSRAAALDRYVALKSQIETREALLSTLEEEVVLVENNIQRNTEVVQSLNEDILRLEEEYAMMARKAQRLKMSNSKLLFIFSADGFNDAIKRWQYIKQYDNYRKKQARLILGTQTTLSEKILQLETQREDKELLMASGQEQKVILEEEMVVKGSILKNLRQDESRLRNQLANKRKAHKKLNNAIENTIRNEIVAQRKRAREPEALAATSPPATSSSTTPSTVRSPAAPAPRTNRSYTNTTNSNNASKSATALTGAFRGSRGQLSWPVASGVITSYFGKQAHPTLKKIQITNNGIDIQTQQNATVKAVFQGEVVGTQFIPGHHYMVILRHGNYYTVYSNLENVLVKRGETVSMQQALGQVAIDGKSGKSEVHFEVWRDKLRLNPTDWVRR